MIKLPVIASKDPIAVNVEAGKKYFWCSCGLSSKAPFCDGKHKEYKGEDGLPIMKPQVFEAKENATIYFCNCKQSKNAPFCDGSHANI